MKTYALKFQGETIEFAILAGTYRSKREAEEDANHLVASGKAEKSYEIVELEE